MLTHFTVTATLLREPLAPPPFKVTCLRSHNWHAADLGFQGPSSSPLQYVAPTAHILTILSFKGRLNHSSAFSPGLSGEPASPVSAC